MNYCESMRIEEEGDVEKNIIHNLINTGIEGDLGDGELDLLHRIVNRLKFAVGEGVISEEEGNHFIKNPQEALQWLEDTYGEKL